MSAESVMGDLEVSAITAVSATSQGGREYQEDAAAHGYRTTADSPYLIAAVADGIGSAYGSEYVAQAAVGMAVRLGIAVDHGPILDELVRATHAAVAGLGDWVQGAAGTAFRDFQARLDSYSANSTLVVCTVGTDAEVNVAWVGDSRAYVLTADLRLHQLSQDHNYARYIKGGPANLLTRSFGGITDSDHDGPERTHYLGTGPARARRVLLCSDGVNGPLDLPADGAGDRSGDPIRAALADLDATPKRVAHNLVKWAVRAGGASADNATALVIDIPPAPVSPQPAAAVASAAGGGCDERRHREPR